MNVGETPKEFLSVSSSSSSSSSSTNHNSNNIIPNKNIKTKTKDRVVRVAGYEIQKKLGSGSFATVYRGIRKDLNVAAKFSAKSSNRSHSEQKDDLAELPNVVAIKAISKRTLSKKVLSNLDLEIRILNQLKCVNIVELYHVVKEREDENDDDENSDDYDRNSSLSKQRIYLILEYCGGGDLQRLIRSRKAGRLSETLSRRLMRDLSNGLRFLWNRQLIHRDIKPQNLMLTNRLPQCEEDTDPLAENANYVGESVDCEFRLKIADFGFARHLNRSTLADTLCGSPLYMAPEILQHQRYDAKADLWSTGTVLFEMLTGKPPFGGENHMDLLRNIQRKAVRLPQGVRVSSECINLLKILLHRNPMRRANFEQFYRACEAFVALGCNGNPSADDTDSSKFAVHINTAKGLHCIQEQDTVMDEVDTDSSLPVVTPIIGPRQHNNATPIPSISNTRNQTSSHFAPLIASPSIFSFKSPSGVSIPPPFSLGPQASSSPAIKEETTSLCITPETPPHSNITYQREEERSQSSFRSTKFGNNVSSSTSSSSGDEFVMVQSPSKNSLYLNHNRHQQPPLHLYHKRASSNIVKPSNNGSTMGSCNMRMRSGSNFLSTSPGTGEALIAAMRIRDPNSDIPSSNNKSRAFMNFGARGKVNADIKSQCNNFSLASNMLAAAEDVGRRSVNVAHVGDTRAFIAMRLLVSVNTSNANSTSSSTCGPSPMEGVVEERSSLLFSSPPSAPFACDLNENVGVSSRRLSSTSEHGAFDMDDDDDMPFVSSSTRDTSAETSLVNNNSFNNRASSIFLQQHAMVYTHLREALSCYLKALKLMKGAVNAAQRVMDVIASIGQRSLDSNTNMKFDHPNSELTQRCKVSLQWLSEQFKGVLDRADATKLQLEKIKSKYPEAIRSQEQQCAQAYQSRTKLLPSVSISLNGNDMALVPLSAEELVYNHAMACGKDAAVKQLLGQNDAANASYKSAGLLIEALLMEPNLPEDDRKLLEGYMYGFKERVLGLRKMNLASQCSSRRQTV